MDARARHEVHRKNGLDLGAKTRLTWGDARLERSIRQRFLSCAEASHATNSRLSVHESTYDDEAVYAGGSQVIRAGARHP